MKTKNYQPLTKSAIPDGEGFIALPISFFNSVITSPSGTSGKAMTKYQR